MEQLWVQLGRRRPFEAGSTPLYKELQTNQRDWVHRTELGVEIRLDALTDPHSAGLKRTRG